MRIRILKATTPGDEPLFVREAWVGLVLPLQEGTPQPGLVIPAELPWRALSFRQRLARLFVKQLAEQATLAYRVSGVDGIEILKRERPKAAQWWQDKVPEAISKGFRFRAENCELLQSEPA